MEFSATESPVCTINLTQSHKVSFFGILFLSQRVYRFTWQVQLSSPYTPKVLQTYLMGPGHYSTVILMVIR
jgi:hypothetical protein